MLHTLVQSLTTPSGQVSASKQYSAAASIELDEVAPIAADTQFGVNIDVSAVKSFWLSSDQDVTVETNNAGAPVDTIALKKDVPYLWNTDSYDTFKLTADVTALFITNASPAAANIKMRVGYDPTP